MKVRPATPEAINHVVIHMREASAREAFVSCYGESRAELAAAVVSLCKRAGALLALTADDGAPIALVGAFLIAPGRASMIFLATDGFPAIAFAVHRWFIGEFVPVVLGQYRRVEFVGGADDGSARWLRSLGFEREGVARRYGKNGEDFAYWAWLRPQVDVGAAGLGSDPPSTAGTRPHV